MKVVAKYTLVLVAALAAALAALTWWRMQRDRAHLQDDMVVDHRVVSRVLRAIAIDLWRSDPAHGGPAIARLIDRANQTGGPTTFAWIADRALPESPGEVDDRDLVSRLPVVVDGRALGTIEVHESLDATERQVGRGVALSVISVGVVVALSFAASLVLGRWLVGKPIGLLVAQARRIGRRELGAPISLGRHDELGELAGAMDSMRLDLAQALAQITRETDARVRAVEQMRHADRLSTVGKLAAGLAHELGTPLAIVSGHAQMIAGDEVRGEAVADSARAIDREASRMSRIVRQLLDFARRRGPVGTASELGPVITRCLELLAPMIAGAKVTAHVTGDGALRALIDDDSLQQVLTNLIVNALQAMATGGALTITTARAQAAPPRDPDAAPRAFLRVDVRDTGPGISADVRPHVFEPFFTTKPPGEGTGLGLAVVYGIVDDHGGWITVDSDDRGSTFSVFLQEVPP